MTANAPNPCQAEIHFLGEGAMVLRIEEEGNAAVTATLASQQRLWAIAVKASAWPHIRDVVPGMNNLTIIFDPLIADADQLADKLLTTWNKTSAVVKSGRQIEIPVLYGGKRGPDLTIVAAHTGLSVAEVIKRHTAADYIVFFLGFQPGFAYMGGLDHYWQRRVVASRVWSCLPDRSRLAAAKPLFIPLRRRVAGS